MRDHWWWRPGWHVGQRMYTWHITFDGQDDLHSLVATYQSVLATLPGLDLIPKRWLHLTMQGVGFVDEVQERDIQRIVDAARARCASKAPFELTFTAPKIDPEAIMFALRPAGPAQALRRQVRAAIGDVWGVDRVPEAEQWSPPRVPAKSIAGMEAGAPLVDHLIGEFQRRHAHPRSTRNSP